jgi:hypothetical protein
LYWSAIVARDIELAETVEHESLNLQRWPRPADSHDEALVLAIDFVAERLKHAA